MDPDILEIEGVSELLVTEHECTMLSMHMLQEKPYEPSHMVAHSIHGHWETQLLASLLQGETPLSPHSCCSNVTTKQMLPR